MNNNEDLRKEILETISNSYRYLAYLDCGCMELLKKLYQFDENEFLTAFENVEDMEVRLFLAAFLLMEKNEAVDSKQLENWVKKSFTNNIIKFLCEIDLIEEEWKIVNEYINGNNEVFTEAVTIVNSKIDIVNEHIFNNHSYTGLVRFAYFSKDLFEESKRLLKLLVVSKSKEVIEEIVDYLEDKRYCRFSHEIEMSTVLTILDNNMKELEIPREYYIEWLAYKYLRKRMRVYKNYLSNVFEKDKEDVEKAALISDGAAKGYLYSYFLKEEKNQKYIKILEKEAVDRISLLFKIKQIEEEEIEDLKLYLKGERLLEEIKVTTFDNIDYYKYLDPEYILDFIWLKEYSLLFDRLFKYMFVSNHQKSLELIIEAYCERGLEKIDFNNFKTDGHLVRLVNELEPSMDMEKTLPLIIKIATSGNDWKVRGAGDEIFSELIGRKTEEFIKYSSFCNSSEKEYLIKELTKEYKKDRKRKEHKLSIDSEKYYMFLLDNIGASTKSIRNTVIQILQGDYECRDFVLPFLHHKKADTRAGAVIVIISIIDELCKKELKDRLKIEKSSKVKNLILEFLQDEVEEEKTEEGNIDIYEYCKDNLNKRKKKKVQWLEINTLPPLKLRDSKEYAQEEILYYLLISFADNKEIKFNFEGKRIAQYLDESSLNDLTIEILNKWIEDYADTKRKWVLSMAAMFGDSRAIQVLSTYIKKWGEGGRSAIACEAVKALALQGSSEALMIVDGISRKFKNKKVKEAAGDAMEFAAKELEVSVEELADRIVPTLGFNENGERIFDYGSRKFKVLVTSEFQLQVYKEDGKVLKNLPSIGKNDDEELASKARQEFKMLKKQLKTLVNTQTQRLDNVFSINRKWTIEKWTKLFVDNYIMHRFAEGLIWGIYEGDKLIQSFRYMEDGTFNTVDEEEYSLGKDEKIGLVHPLELSKEGLQKWKEQLEDYEIIQPVEQVQRKIFTLTEEEKDMSAIERFGGIKLEDSSLLRQMLKLGWYKGSIVDGGGFSEFYKEDLRSSVAAELHFSGMYVSGGYEDVTVEEIIFYKTGTVCRGSYIYDFISKENLIKPSELPARFLSEILYDVYRATESNLGFDEKWKKRK